MKFLLCDPYLSETPGYIENLSKLVDAVQACVTGKECQLKIFKECPDYLIVDVETKSHSALEVVKYVRVNHLPIKVFLSFRDETQLQELGLDNVIMGRAGIDGYLFRPISPDDLVSKLSNRPQVGRTSEGLDTPLAANEVFEKIDFFPVVPGTLLTMTYYVQNPGGGHDVLLRKGEVFDPARLESAPGLEAGLFYRRSDRLAFISFVNELAEKIATIQGTEPTSRLRLIHSAADRCLAQLDTTGMSAQYAEEGKKICRNLVSLVKQHPTLVEAFDKASADFPLLYRHWFMVAFYSTVIARQLSWNSARTTEFVAMGGLFHDIGLRDLDASYRSGGEDRWATDEAYQGHAAAGSNYVRNLEFPEPVAQIILQHHELNDGTGYPHGIKGNRIYPLAKIVSLADGFTNFLDEKQCHPLEGLREFVSDRRTVLKYDTDAIKSLIKGFIKDEEKKKNAAR